MTSGAAITKSGGVYSRYLAIGQYLDSFWTGRAAERLGIAGSVADEKSFQALTELRDPSTGEVLKPRHKQKITMWDLTIGAPKSASLVALFDRQVALAHFDAAAKAIEHEQALIPTKNMVYTQVHHFTSRAGDQHLHTHSPIINLTFNDGAGKWECLRPHFLGYWQQYQITERYRTDYARDLIKLGYEIEDRPKQGFEIAGVAPEIILRHSQRNREIHATEDYAYREAAYRTRGPKLLYADTYDIHIQQQKEKLTQAERISLKNTVEVAQERAYKLNLRFDVGEAEESGPELKPWTYGIRM